MSVLKRTPFQRGLLHLGTIVTSVDKTVAMLTDAPDPGEDLATPAAMAELPVMEDRVITMLLEKKARVSRGCKPLSCLICAWLTD